MTLCNEINCNSNAYYGIKYKTPIKCNIHKKVNMKNVMDTLCLQCHFRGIDSQANYGFKDKEPTSCFRCSVKDMVNISKSIDKSKDRKAIMDIISLYGYS